MAPLAMPCSCAGFTALLPSGRSPGSRAGRVVAVAHVGWKRRALTCPHLLAASQLSRKGKPVNRKLTIALGAAVLGVALIPATARASTPQCTGGTYAGYCGTQADSGSPVLVMDVKGLRFNVGTPVIGWTNSSTDPATDWFQLPQQSYCSLQLTTKTFELDVVLP